MRTALLAIAIITLIVPSTYGQAPTSWTDIAQDPTGDVAFSGTPVPETVAASMDLVKLQASVVAENLAFALGVSNLNANTPAADSSAYLLDFLFEGVGYRITIERNVPIPVLSSAIVYSATLAQYDMGLATYLDLAELNVTVNAQASTMAVTFPATLIKGQTGLPARNGSTLENISASSRQLTANSLGTILAGAGTPPTQGLIADRMPDTGSVTYAIQTIIAATSQLIVDSPDPIRATNGGPGTFVYPIRATNIGSTSIEVGFTIENLPTSWQVSFVDDVLQVPPGETRTTSAVVQPPFGHAHGTTTNLTVQARSTADTQVGNNVILQLYYSDPPQPAGHHPQLFIHSFDNQDVAYSTAIEPTTGFTNRDLFMNANSEDPRNSGQLVNAESGEGTDHYWRISMSPALGMGLDFEKSGIGKLQGQLTSSNTMEIPGVKLSAVLLLAVADQEIPLASGTNDAPLTIGETPVEFEVQLPVKPESDYIPYTPGSNLILEIHAEFQEPGAEIGVTTLNLQPGARLQLPLLEYQDLIPLPQLGHLVVEAPDDLRQVNAGGHTVFEFKVRNDGQASLGAQVEALDVSKNYIAAIQPADLNIKAGDSATVNVEVTVPNEAQPGDVISAFVAVRPNGADQSVLVRLSVSVTDQEVDNQQLAPAKDTPLGALPISIALMAALATARKLSHT